MTTGLLHPDFTLVEAGQTLSVSDLQAKAGVIDVAREGAKGVICGLLAADTSDIFLLRDKASPLPAERSGGAVWLQTSGTTGTPKWVAHDLARLNTRISAGKGDPARWLLSFNPGSFAGVQVILSAMKGGHVLIAPSYGASVAEMAEFCVITNVTHVSATPTFWRAFLMALGDHRLDLKSVTLGGEAADQSLLDAVRARFPEANLRHIYATTEAGSVFSVSDGRAGFPREWLGKALNGLILSVSASDTLRVENPQASDLARAQAWDTGDVVEITDDRVLFKGRVDAMVNVGGVKVFPETVEAHLLELPFIQDVRVTAKPNPITGHILIADILLKPLSGEVEAQIRARLAHLPRAFRPASLRFVTALEIGATGKKLRTND